MTAHLTFTVKRSSQEIYHSSCCTFGLHMVHIIDRLQPCPLWQRIWGTADFLFCNLKQRTTFFSYYYFECACVFNGMCICLFWGMCTVYGETRHYHDYAEGLHQVSFFNRLYLRRLDLSMNTNFSNSRQSGQAAGAGDLMSLPSMCLDCRPFAMSAQILYMGFYAYVLDTLSTEPISHPKT